MLTLHRAGMLVAFATLTACGGKETGAAADPSAGVAKASAGTIAGSGDGYRLTMEGTSDGGPAAKGGAPVSMTTTVRVLDGKARIDYARGGAPGLARGGWMLIEAGGARVSIVDSSAKRVMVMDSIANPFGAMMQMTLKDTSSRVEALGAGETVLGFPTKKYRLTTAYTMEMSMMGQPMPVRMEQVAIAHVSDADAMLDAGLASFEQSFRSTTGGAGGAAASRVLAALAASRPKGFALMQEMESRVIRDGDTTTTRSSYRVTQMERGGVQPSDFVVPADYAQTDVGAQMRGAQDRASAAMKKSGVTPEQMRKAMEAMQKARAGSRP